MSGESSVRSKRERKPVDVFKASPKAEKREEIIPEGEGIALGEIPFANRGLSKLKEDDEVLKSLHSLIFGGLGKAGDRKKKLRLFSGFDRDTEIGDKEDRVLENKKWTVMKLKQACDCFGLQKAGTREELCTRLVKYLAVPYVVKDISGATASPSRSSSKSPKGKSKTSKTVKKRKSRGKSTGSTSDGPTKKKRAPSGYILFSTAMRQEAKEEYPDASFTDLTKILGEKWNELEDEDKQVWLDKSEKLKNDLKEAEEEVEEEEAVEEEQEDDDEEEVEEEDADVEEEEEEESKENGEEKVEEAEEKEEAAEEAEVEDEEGDKEEEEEQVFKKSKIEDEKVQQQIEDNEIDALVSDSLPDQTDNNESGPKVTIEEPPAEVSEEVPVVEVTNENVVVEEVE